MWYVIGFVLFLGAVWVSPPVQRAVRHYRESRDQKLWERWNQALTLMRSGYRIGRIVSIRQRARTGTKGYVDWHPAGGQSAFWIPGVWPSVGQYLVVQGSFGHGEHHQEDVFYIDTPSALLVPKQAPTAWERHEERINQRLEKEIELHHSTLSRAADATSGTETESQPDE